MQPVLPEDVQWILNRLTQAGFEAYIVGGCVRDCILKRQPQDWDITTSAQPEKVQALFEHTFETGIAHGTVTVVRHKTNYEVTTYRVDGEYKDCRHPEQVFFTSHLEEDLLRRDFTMNAIAYHPKEGFQDPYKGQEDIKKRLIRGVGIPANRFQEDALRMLRGIRFSAQLDFEIETKTYQALLESSSLVKNISVERIREELDKLLMADYLERMPLLWESGLLQVIDLPLFRSMEKQGGKIVAQLKKAAKDKILRWSIFLQNFDTKETERFLKYLKFDGTTQKAVLQLIENLDTPLPKNFYEIRKQAGVLGVERFRQWVELQKVRGKEEEALFAQKGLEKILEQGDCFHLKQLKVTGEDLLALGMEKGKEVGKVLQELLDMVQQNPEKNQTEYLLEFVREKRKTQGYQ